MKNTTLFLILLAAGICYGQEFYYDPGGDQIIFGASPDCGVPPLTTISPDNEFAAGDIIYQNDYWYDRRDFITRESYIFSEYSNKEIFYLQTIRILGWKNRQYYRDRRWLFPVNCTHSLK